MDWMAIGAELIKKGLPLLGNLVKTSNNPVISMISKVLGVSGELPDDIYAALKDKPNAILKLKELEDRHKEKFCEITLEFEKARLLDVQSARMREIQSGNVGKDTFMYALGGLIVVGFFGLGATMMFAGDIPQPNLTILNMVVGALIASFSSVVGYFYGSSKGSADKNRFMK